MSDETKPPNTQTVQEMDNCLALLESALFVLADSKDAESRRLAARSAAQQTLALIYVAAEVQP
ncbi:MAG TPA: hypothetical protein VGJ84_19110 [Polyangiaceae bacterium]